MKFVKIRSTLPKYDGLKGRLIGQADRDKAIVLLTDGTEIVIAYDQLEEVHKKTA